jgi:integrase
MPKQPPPALEPWAEAWEAFLRDGKSAITRQNYRSYAKRIDAFRAEHGVHQPDDFSDALEGKFLEQFPVPTTKWTYQKALRAFFNWGMRNKWRHYPARAKRVTLTELDEPLDLVDHMVLDKLVAQATPRDRALLIFTYYTAARASEVRHARLDYWHRTEHVMVIEQTKTGKRREMPVPETAAREINRYIDHGRPATRQPWLFLTSSRRDGDYQQLSRSAMSSIFRRLRLALGIPAGQASAQLLRRGRATELAAKTRDTHHLMRLGGWSDPRSLRRYLVHTIEQDKQLIEQIERER